ncbi:MAG TPA: hypothetical protein VJW16_03020 [Lysobacter sp.]|nr:hypothetical protein [Lysobacter sp.]
MSAIDHERTSPRRTSCRRSKENEVSRFQEIVDALLIEVALISELDEMPAAAVNKRWKLVDQDHDVLIPCPAFDGLGRPEMLQHGAHLVRAIRTAAPHDTDPGLLDELRDREVGFIGHFHEIDRNSVCSLQPGVELRQGTNLGCGLLRLLLCASTWRDKDRKQHSDEQ